MIYLIVPYDVFKEHWTIDTLPEHIEEVVNKYIKDGDIKEEDKIYECKLIGKATKTIKIEFEDEKNIVKMD